MNQLDTLGAVIVVLSRIVDVIRYALALYKVIRDVIDRQDLDRKTPRLTSKTRGKARKQKPSLHAERPPTNNASRHLVAAPSVWGCLACLARVCLMRHGLARDTRQVFSQRIPRGSVRGLLHRIQKIDRPSKKRFGI